MKQSLQDIKLVIQNDRRIWAAAGAILVILMIWGVAGQNTWGGAGGRPRVQTAADDVPVAMSDNDQYKDLIVAYRTDIDNQAKILTSQQDTLQRLQNDFKDHQARVTGIFETLVDKVETISSEVQQLKEGQTRVVQDNTGKGNTQLASPEPENTIVTFGMDKATVQPPPPPPKPTKMLFIASGDSVPIKLLTGVNAPVDGTPYPVVFKLTGPISGPDGSSLDLGEARLIAAATGSETDGRVLFRLTDLAIRHKDGRRSVIKVDGWVVGEDGVRGMKGKLIDKLGRLIAATAGYSFIAALGERMDDKNDNVEISNSPGATVSSEDMNVATTSALTDASNRLGQILLDRYEKLIPVVEVLSNREVAAVFSQPAEVSLWDDEDDGEGIYSASLE